MAKYYDFIPPHLVKWILKQEMFWVATAPLNGGLVNMSPKGEAGMFHVIDGNKVWYQDLTGSGSETMAHLREPGNARITIMFNSFGATPMILRLWGTGIAHEFGTPEYDSLISPEERRPGSRCAVVIDVHKVGTSCGFGVPMYEFQGHRPTLLKWLASLENREQKAAAAGLECTDGLKAYWTRENMVSLDGLPGMKEAHVSLRVPRYEQAVMSEEEQMKFAQALKVKTQGATGAIPSKLGVLDASREEVARLVAAFAIGVAAAVAYVRYEGRVRG